jgi:glutathione S-transferase
MSASGATSGDAAIRQLPEENPAPWCGRQHALRQGLFSATGIECAEVEHVRFIRYWEWALLPDKGRHAFRNRRTAVTIPANPIRLYRHALSGHAHRVELFLSLLGLPCELIAVDMVRGAHKAADFVAKNNPFGQVPVMEDGDIAIADSNAILVYLATRYDSARRWLPRDPVAAARVQQWLSVAAGQLAYGPSMARLAVLFGARLDLERARAIGRQLYDVLDGYLIDRRFLVGDTPTIADIAIYSYTAHAPEGGVLLDPYAHVRAWLARIEALHGFVAMRQSAPPEPSPISSS